ncbi:MAG: hypothetical protein WBN85_06190, partial [Candidatus Macondimonas sp.]
LEALETLPGLPPSTALTPQLSLFAPPEPEAVAMLRALDPDRLSPREALELVYRLRERLPPGY